jgi:hypothetical protein
MQQSTGGFGSGVTIIVNFIMSIIGGIDDGFSAFMLAAGVYSPGLQLAFLLIMVIAAVILSLRLLGGGLGWLVLLFCVMLLLHRLVVGSVTAQSALQ